MANTDNVMFRNAYHVKNGATLMYAIDAQIAAGQFPDEWSLDPWPDQVEPAPKGKKGAKTADNTGDNQ